MVAMHHKNSNVAAAVFFEGCFLANGWVTDTNLSHVTRESISTEDSHDSVLRNPANKSVFINGKFQNPHTMSYHITCKYNCVSKYTDSSGTLHDSTDLQLLLSISRYPSANPRVPNFWDKGSVRYWCWVQNVFLVVR